MRSKTGILVAIAALMMLVMAMTASAAYPTITWTWSRPAIGGTVSGAYIFNVTALESAGVLSGNVTQVFLEYKTTTASSWTAMNASNLTNRSWSPAFQQSFDTLALYDSAVYQLRATAYNVSGDQIGQDTSMTGFYIDNHNPATPTFQTLVNNKEVFFGSTKGVVKADIRNASSCEFRIYDSAAHYTVVAGSIDDSTAASTGSAVCSHAFMSNDFAEGLKYAVSVASKDLGSSADTAESTLVTSIKFTKEMSTAKRAAIDDDEVAAQVTQSASNTKLLIGVLIVGAAGWYFLKKRK
jgi:LPXTG-motif cell wall-anchored protein